MAACDRQTDRVLLVPLHRSRCGTLGERERCLQQLREQQGEMKNVEDRMKTSINDRQQFEYALTNSISFRKLGGRIVVWQSKEGH